MFLTKLLLDNVDQNVASILIWLNFSVYTTLAKQRIALLDVWSWREDCVVSQ